MRITSPQHYENTVFHLTQTLLPLSLITGLTLLVGLFYGLSDHGSAASPVLNPFCDANGKVHIEYTTGFPVKRLDSFWDPNFFLGITIGFGSFSFAAARIIDGAWDVVVSRLGQALLALLAYPVLRRSLNAEMERFAVAMPLFASLALDKISITTAWKVLSQVLERFKSGWRTGVEGRPGDRPNPSTSCSWRYLGWLLILAYLLAFPTMTSMMTGYQPPSEPYVTPPDGEYLVPVSDFKLVPLLLAGGESVGLPRLVSVSSSDDSPTMQNLRSYYDTCVPSLSEHYDNDDSSYPRVESCPGQVCNCTISLQELGGNYYIPVVTSSNITLNNRTWAPGGLDIFKQCALPESGMDCMQGDTYLTDGNHILTAPFMEEHGFCRPLNTYQWGFSSLALLTHLAITIFAAIVLTALHFDAYWNGRSDRQVFDSNLYSDAVTVCRELEGLTFECPSEEVPARELKAAVKKEDVLVKIDDGDLLPSRWTSRALCKQRQGTAWELEKF